MKGKIGYFGTIRWVVFLMCCSALQHLSAKDATIDSLKQVLLTTNSDSIRYQICKKIGDAYYDVNLDSTVIYYHRAIDFARDLKYSRGHISTLRSLGYTFSKRSSNYKKALNYFEEACDIANKHKDTVSFTYLLSDLGVLYWNKGLSIQAADHHFRAYQLAQRLKHPRLIMKTCMSLGVLYNEESDNAKALMFYRTAIPIADTLQRKRVKGVLLNNMGKAHRDDLKMDSAAIYFNQALEVFEELEDNDWKSLVYYNIAKNHYILKHNNEAVDLYIKALELNQTIDNKNREVMILTGLAESYVEQEKYQKAIEVAKKGLKILEQIDTKLYKKELYQILASSYEKQQKYEVAYQNFQLYLLAKDNLLEEEKSNKIAQFTHLYESEKKKVEIAELKVENASKQMEINQSKSIIRLLIGGFLMLLAFISAGYFYLKNKSLEENKQLRVQLTHDLHDNVNSSLNHIKIIAGRLSRGAYSPTEKQDNLQRIRSISNDLVNNMHDLIWTLDDNKTKLVDLLDKMEDHASNVFSSLKVSYFLDNEIESSNITMKTDVKNNIYSIFKEVINNIIKHTHPTDVEIYFSLEKDVLYMSVKNNTKHLKTPSSSSQIGLKSIRNRAATINGKVEIQEFDQTYRVTLKVPL